ALLAFPVMAQEQKPFTPEQKRVEQLIYNVLDFKNKLGAEMQISVQLKAQTMQLQKKIAVLNEKLKAANAKIAQLEPGPKEEKVSDNKGG
ncbi:hypothetical protein LCGC14_2209210, partial [marine sediment metagenome]